MLGDASAAGQRRTGSSAPPAAQKHSVRPNADPTQHPLSRRSASAMESQPPGFPTEVSLSHRKLHGIDLSPSSALRSVEPESLQREKAGEDADPREPKRPRRSYGC